ncbi:DNA cytosine methyltransferase [Lacrimispora sphenoides]|uniref:Site-specific DNA-cytosine methylase n=1 Tax=Lacrimispora sphenoides JCM 1415 TaxID=1297793 RepID=A0ABY1C5B3_9FIRM|nr:DNA cytosine methyltransferase [Lacrimispora sphenoides]SET69083.1 Site-specific DNA-cytosine methylase [[Clostridium] sphenoides JCM 1415]SUY50519.1 DNA-cytosine methyltransferase [Lacrimispora sphenoides]
MKISKKLTVVDLLTGIGGRALGFQEADYDVVCAVDADPICREIYSQTIRNSRFILSDISKISAKDLPNTDLIIAKLVMNTFKDAGKLREEEEQNKNDYIFDIILEKIPMAFVLEIPSIMITNKKSSEFRNMLGAKVFRKYSISYQIINEADFSGFPVIGKQSYMVGIRNDLYDEEFYFPYGNKDKNIIYQEQSVTADSWYRKITFNPNIELDKDKYYIRQGREFYESGTVHMGFFREMYLMDSIGLRRFTHNECAHIKGLKKYNYNKCTNKQDMYRRIAYASNVFVCYEIALALKKYLQNGLSVHSKVNDMRNQKKEKTKESKLPNNLSDDIIYPKHKILSMHVDSLKGLKNLDISLDKNLTAIMGVNGAGKSTILHALACVYGPYKLGENHKFSFFFTPNPDSSWKNSKFSITYWDENLQKEITREYRKNTDRWAPRYSDRPKRDAYYIGIETCIPEIEKEQQTSYIDYNTILANDKVSCKIIESAAYILNKNYDNLNYHKTKKKELIGVHTKDNMRYSSLSMGAGEQRVLKILKTVYAANAYSVILIDEIDLLLHVLALKRLIKKLSDIAIKKNLQIIFTTHSMEVRKFQDIVDIRYLDPLEEKTMVYDKINQDIVYELSEDVNKIIRIYVEDILAETIVNVVAGTLGISRAVKVVKIGSASNAFVLAASLILQKENIRDILILLDGDVYRSQGEKLDAVKRVLSGTEKDHEDKVNMAAALIRQLILPEKTEPEKHIFDMLIEMQDNDEIVKVARKQKAVSNSHQWLDNLVVRIGKSEELILDKIINLVAEHERWEEYVNEIREWLINKKEILHL